MALCVESRADVIKVTNYTGEIIDFDWEDMSISLFNIAPIIDIMLNTFDADRICKGVAIDDEKVAGLVKVEAHKIKNCGNALKHPNLSEKAMATAVVCRACDKHGTWCEGCFCHGYILESDGRAWRDRVKDFRKQSSGCTNKGVRSSALAFGHAKKIAPAVRNATHPILQQRYAAMDPHTRSNVMSFEQSLKNVVATHLEENDEMQWECMEFNLLGCFASSGIGRFGAGLHH